MVVRNRLPIDKKIATAALNAGLESRFSTVMLMPGPDAVYRSPLFPVFIIYPLWISYS